MSVITGDGITAGKRYQTQCCGCHQPVYVRANRDQLDAWDERGRRRPVMLLWAASMTVSFIANRHLVAIAQQQVQQASAENAAGRTPACALALRKTLSQLEYRSQHGAPWYLRAGLQSER